MQRLLWVIAFFRIDLDGLGVVHDCAVVVTLGPVVTAAVDVGKRGHASRCSGIDPGKQEIEQLFCPQELDKNP